MIRKTPKGYVIYSEPKDNGRRKALSKPYKTRKGADKRLSQIEYFKNQ